MLKGLINKYKLYLPILLLLVFMVFFKIVIGKAAASFFVMSSKILVLYIVALMFYKLRNPIKRMMHIPLNTQWIPAFRVLYALLCLYSFFQNLTLIESQLEPSSFRRLGIEFTTFNAYFYNAIYFLSLIAILIGYRVRWAFVVLFITGGIIIPFSLEIFLKNIINFYAIFIPTYAWHGKKSDSDQTDGWPVFLMVASLSFLMTVAGVCKLLDPVWQSSIGLYYTLNISYFTPKFFWFLLDYPDLLAVLNWVTIMVEVSCMPFLFFKRTRILSLFCLVFLGLFLTFIMGGIGIVGGPLALVGCFLALSISKIPVKLNKYVPKIPFSFFNKKERGAASKFETQFLSMAVFAITFVHIFFYSTDLFFHNLNHRAAPRYGNYINNSPKILSESSYLYKAINTTSKSLKIIEVPDHWRFIWSLHLFDYDHLYERRVFRVVFEDEEGNTFEPRKYFDEYGSMHDEYPLWSNERFFFLSFRINEALNPDGFDEDRFVVQVLIEEMNTIINYSNKNNKKYKTAKILLKNLYQPFEYQKDHKPWVNDDWYTFYSFDANSQKGTIHKENMEMYDYSNLKVKIFQDKIITPNF